MSVRTFARCFLTLLLLCAATAPSDQICGLWWNEERDAKLEVYRSGESFEARIVWLQEPAVEGKPKLDVNHPDPALRHRPTLGLVILRGLRKPATPVSTKRGASTIRRTGKPTIARSPLRATN